MVVRSEPDCRMCGTFHCTLDKAYDVKKADGPSTSNLLKVSLPSFLDMMATGALVEQKTHQSKYGCHSNIHLHDSD